MSSCVWSEFKAQAVLWEQLNLHRNKGYCISESSFAELTCHITLLHRTADIKLDWFSICYMLCYWIKEAGMISYLSCANRRYIIINVCLPAAGIIHQRMHTSLSAYVSAVEENLANTVF